MYQLVDFFWWGDKSIHADGTMTVIMMTQSIKMLSDLIFIIMTKSKTTLSSTSLSIMTILL